MSEEATFLVSQKLISLILQKLRINIAKSKFFIAVKTEYTNVAKTENLMSHNVRFLMS